jgi:hypothetical protein
MKAGTKITIEIGETTYHIPKGWKDECASVFMKMTVNGKAKEGRVIIGPKQYATNDNILHVAMKDPFIYEEV